MTKLLLDKKIQFFFWLLEKLLIIDYGKGYTHLKYVYKHIMCINKYTTIWVTNYFLSTMAYSFGLFPTCEPQKTSCSFPWKWKVLVIWLPKESVWDNMFQVTVSWRIVVHSVSAHAGGLVSWCSLRAQLLKHPENWYHWIEQAEKGGFSFKNTFPHLKVKNVSLYAFTVECSSAWQGYTMDRHFCLPSKSCLFIISGNKSCT